MKNKPVKILILFLISFLAIQSCVNHPNGGVNSSSLLVYSDTTLSEESGNTGAFNKDIAVTLRGSKFVATLTKGEEFDAIDLPDGLSVTVTRQSSTQATIHVSGTATSHNGCGKNKMAFYFMSGAFEDGKLPIAFEATLNVVYIKPLLNFTTTNLEEASTNNGTFSTVITVNTSNDGSFTKSSGNFVEGTDYELYSIPTGLTTTVTAISSTQATIAFSGTADDNTPMDDIKGGIQFKSAALSSDFCENISKQDINFKMYRSVVMFATTNTMGLIGGGSGGRDSADSLCQSTAPNLPDDYNGIRAFISVTGADEISDIDNLYQVPTGVMIESSSGKVIANTWTDLLDGTLDQSLADAEVLPSSQLFWSGSNAGGIAVADRCSNWTEDDGGTDGQVGSSDETNGDWLTNADAVQTCDTELPILCIGYVQD